jgi:hypothetical protein
MKAKDLFTVILKVFGIYLIKDVLISIPVVLNSFVQILNASDDMGMAIFSLFVSLLALGLYSTIVYLLLFKTAVIISKLNLTADLSEEPVVLNLHRSSVLAIAIIVSGLIILAFAIPTLVKRLYAWYEYVSSRNHLFLDQYYDFGQLFTSIAEVIIGLLFLGNQKTLVNYIEFKRRKVHMEAKQETETEIDN